LVRAQEGEQKPDPKVSGFFISLAGREVYPGVTK
jgi:hypothetical protein